jgi:hypothetical protein
MKTVATQHLEVAEAKYVSDYKLLLTFNDGEVRVVDFGPFLEKARNPDTTDYRDLKKFKSFRIADGDLVWGDYQMIFPIMDLYCGSILKGEEPDYYRLNEGRTSQSIAFPTKTSSNVSYKKPLKRKKLLPHV